VFLCPQSRCRIPPVIGRPLFAAVGMGRVFPDQLRRVPAPVKLVVKTKAANGGSLTYTFLVRTDYFSGKSPVVTIRRVDIVGIPPTRCPLECFLAIQSKAGRAEDGTIDLYQLRTILKDYELSESPLSELVLATVAGSGQPVETPFVNFTTTAEKGEASKESPPVAQVVGITLGPPCAAPVPSAPMADLAVKSQMDLQKCIEPTDEMIEVMVDFVTELYGVVGDLQPWTIEKVQAKKSKPAQRAKVKRLLTGFARDDAKLRIYPFTKKEARSKARAIFPVSDEHSMRSARYSLPLYEALCSLCPWFMSGKSGVKIATHIRDFFAVWKKALNAKPASYDVKGCDGSLAKLARVLLATIVIAVFGEKLSEDAIRTIVDEAYACVFTSDGYLQNFFSNMSGSDWTTLLNTIFLAFGQFYGLRKTFPTKTPFALFNMIGPVSGDDGVIIDAIKPEFEKFISDCGMELKWADIPKSLPNGVEFLNRLFPDATESVSSTPALKRLVMTLNVPVGMNGGLANRVAGWRASDPDQQDLKVLLDAVERCTPGLVVPKIEDVEDPDTLVKISNGAWPFEKKRLKDSRVYAAHNLEMDSATFEKWIDSLSKSKTPEDLKALYLSHLAPKELPEGTVPCHQPVKNAAAKAQLALAPRPAKYGRPKSGPDKGGK
jgi:hypothetical protein